MRDHQRWLATRRKLLQQIKQQVVARVGSDPADLLSYVSDYRDEFTGKWTPSEMDHLQQSILQANVVLGGDFHAFSQAQRTHLRILRELPGNKSVVLALECFESRHQKWLDRYLSREIEEAELLSQSLWVRNWGFPWEHYRPLLQLARARGFKVVGINRYFQERSEDTLLRRDHHAATLVSRLVKKNSADLVYVVFGDLHLAKNHLPHRLNSLLMDQDVQVLTLFQNSEKLYFQLARKGLENNVEVMKGSRNRFCILGSPPWVKWQSYLMYLEKAYDRGLEDDEEQLDYTDHVKSLIELAAKDLGLYFKADDVAVYGSGQSSFWIGLEETMNRRQLMVADYLIKNDRSFFVPYAGIFYLSRATINHAASLAGHYIQAKLSGCDQPLWNQPEDFLPLVWLEAIGFFTSKMINHKRKAETLQDIKAQLSVLNEEDRGREALLLVLDQRMTEVISIYGLKKRRRKFKARRKQSYLEAARVLGHMLGEKLYLAYRSHRMSKQSLLSYIEQDLHASDFEDFYYLMVKRLESHATSRVTLEQFA